MNEIKFNLNISKFISNLVAHRDEYTRDQIMERVKGFAQKTYLNPEELLHDVDEALEAANAQG